MKIETRTIRFIEEIDRLARESKYPGHEAIAVIIGAANKSTISEIKGQRQNIQPRQWEKFKAYFKVQENLNGTDKSVPRGTAQEPQEAYKKNPPPADERYIRLMEETIQGLRKDKEKLLNDDAFFKRLLEANLIGLSDVAKTTLAYQKAWVDYMSEKDGAGNPKKVAEIKLHLNKLVASKMGAAGHTDSSS